MMAGLEDRAGVMRGQAVHLVDTPANTDDGAVALKDAQAVAQEHGIEMPTDQDAAADIAAGREALEEGNLMAEDPQSTEGEALATDAALHSTAEPAAEEQPTLVYDTLGPEHAALREFVADAGMRPFLSGICVRDGTAVVTNGSILVIVPTARQAVTDLPVIDGMAMALPEGTEVLVPVAALEKALRLVDKKASVPALQRVIRSYAPAGDGEGPKVLLSATDLETSGTIACARSPASSRRTRR